MTIRDYTWSRSEKIVARRAYDHAYEKECIEILNKVKEMLSELKDPKEIWKIEDYLDKKRAEIDAKYDYRYSVLIMVFARLMSDGFLKESDLQGIDQEKIDAIKKIATY
jgi:hypothetical protein